MTNQFIRSINLIGDRGLLRLDKSKVAVFGLGGVGSFAVEALIRAGIGNLLLVDNDIVTPSNLNRQLIALHSTLGQHKVDIMQQRGQDINPHCKIHTHKIFFDATTLPLVDLRDYDYIIDAIDTVTSKLLLIEYAHQNGIPIISSMGTGNRLNPSLFRVADIFSTKNCPLARVVRQELKKRGIPSLKVVFSEECSKMHSTSMANKAKIPLDCLDDSTNTSTKNVPASISFVPPVAGMILAGEVINDILKDENYA